MFGVAGFRPGRRATFVSAKVAKTIDAPSGLIEDGGTLTLGGRTNSPGSNTARQRIRASLRWASRQASDLSRTTRSIPQYQSKVLGRNSSPVFANLKWLKEIHAIKDGDLATFVRVKACRNTLAHKLFSMLGSEGLPADFQECFSDMVALHRKIWITNVEIPTNPDFEDKELDEEGIFPGSVMSMQRSRRR